MQAQDAGADPGTFRHSILGIETKPSRSITVQMSKDLAAVAVTSRRSLAPSPSLPFPAAEVEVEVEVSSTNCPRRSDCPISCLHSHAW